ncbi:hypothetical protein GCM10007385_09360 [Tateyamaria omphalii]|uniref:hypothetical protein n=1 Tax=Tateyamaria omphalii TaxID=299262 RepID=UPI00167873A8|nr:hypothetical protein [Tateyamaria omphalii]GGX43568.1 hypothetical protein GCM10007385_09360 [Tateyamaria omphalii]
MLLAALGLNLLILIPVIAGFIIGTMDGTFGPDTDARRILICIYIAIAVATAVLITLNLTHHHWAVPMSLALFGVQITYKLATVVALGMASPVVLTNLVVVAVQVAAIVTWSVARG